MSRVKLHFKIDGLSITGEGNASHESTDRFTVLKYARKKAVTDAMKCAFSAVCIVLLPSGKKTVHLVPRSLNYWLANTGDNTDDTNFEQSGDELFGVVQHSGRMGSAMAPGKMVKKES